MLIVTGTATVLEIVTALVIETLVLMVVVVGVGVGGGGVGGPPLGCCQRAIYTFMYAGAQCRRKNDSLDPERCVTQLDKHSSPGARLL